MNMADSQDLRTESAVALFLQSKFPPLAPGQVACSETMTVRQVVLQRLVIHAFAVTRWIHFIPREAR